MVRILLLTLLFIGLFRFIIRFVFPMLRITAAVKKQMRNMEQAQANANNHTAPKPQAKTGDYIDFEEVK